MGDTTTTDYSTVAFTSPANSRIQMASHPTLHQKRHNSNSYDYYDSSYAKRRPNTLSQNVSQNDELAASAACFLDSNLTPSKHQERTPSSFQRATDETPQPSYPADTPQSPFYLPTTSSSNLEAASKVITNDNSSVQLPDTCIDNKQQPERRQQQKLEKRVNNDDKKITRNAANGEQKEGITDELQGTDNTPREQSSNTHADTNQQSDQHNSVQQGSSGGSDDGENNRENSGIPIVNVPPKHTSQALVQKLQDIYRSIVKQEIELQERCSQLTNSQTTDLKNLWVIYKVNAELINNYISFITTALLPSQPEQDLLIGQEIVEIYRVERRLWVYGTITFLDVLKNFSNFMDPEVCCQFISHVFMSISNMLGDVPPRYSIPWLERLGDLSRMAIALYPSGFIDWKLSAEHWYSQALIYTYGHGKLYYHMSTVQQNTLEAFVNLGKSVFCQDTFIPSQQYMQLVIDNIYQRAFAERSGGSSRNFPIVEYLKHSEVMLLPSFLESPELQKVVLTFFQQRFGVWPNNVDFFDHKQIFIQDGEKLRYFFSHAPAFAESHILQLVGFGDPKNPFAILFELPKFLKERKERKERRKSKSSPPLPTNLDDGNGSSSISVDHYFENIDSHRVPYSFPQDIRIWQQSLSYLNLTSMECSMSVLKKFLHAPLLTALPHLLPWAHFLVSVAIRISSLPSDALKKFWLVFMRRIFPWNSLVSFLNTLMAFLLDNSRNMSSVEKLCEEYNKMDLHTLVEHFTNSEELPEVWKCWGTLWFDTISNKSELKASSVQSTGIRDHLFLDAPIDGICFDQDDESGLKFWKRACRVIFMFKGMAKEFHYGIRVSDTPISTRRDVTTLHALKRFSFKFEELPQEWDNEVFLQSDNFIKVFEPISPINSNFEAVPSLSMIDGESIFEFQGYRRMYPDYYCFNKNGDLITGSLYTSGLLERVAIQGGDDFNVKRHVENGVLLAAHNSPVDCNERTPETMVEHAERKWLNMCMDPAFMESLRDSRFPHGDLACNADSNVTYFVLDATSWLRHFAHVYKLATNNVLKFAICLTTFQELRFLRKSKDESVVEAATRAVITARQLYYERKLLPLRFTGNIATHLEEHLEFEEQITWRSHVDEFVIEAVYKSQRKFKGLNLQARDQGQEYIPTDPKDDDKFNFVVLVTDDLNMRTKAEAHDIHIFSSRFMFAFCNQLGYNQKVCIN